MIGIASRRNSRYAFACILAVLLAGCGAVSSSSVPSTSTPMSSGAASPAQTTGVTPMRPAEGAPWIVWQTAEGLALIYPDGSGRHLLFPGESQTFESHHPDWSPDARQIAFANNASDGTSDIWVVNADGTGRRRLIDCQAPCSLAEEPAWSPDGKRIAYWTNGDGQPQVVRVADASTGAVLLTVPAPDLMGPVHPRWAPDGQTLAVEVGVYVADGSTFREADSRIGVIDLRKAQPSIALVTAPGTLALFPDWSPTGDRIAFVGGNLSPFDIAGSPSNLFTINADGSDVRQITHQRPGDPWIATPAWTASARPFLVTAIDPVGHSSALATIGDDGAITDLLDTSGTPVGGAHPRLSPATIP